MKTTLKIQSISDIITNSSSEVFVIKGAGQYEKEISDFLNEVVNLLGYENDPNCDFEVFTADREFYDSCYEYSYSEGDLVIASGTDNSIPYIIMEMIYDLDLLPRFKGKVNGGDITKHHLG